MGYDRREEKIVDYAFSENGNINFHIFELLDCLESLNSRLSEFDELLLDGGLDGINHKNFSEDIEYSCEMLMELIGYSCSTSSMAKNLIDQPLYQNFNLNATESLSRIHLDDYSIENNLGICHTVYRDRQLPVDVENESLKIEDFVGLTMPAVGGGLSVVPEEFRQFTDIYSDFYEEYKESLTDEDGKPLSLDDYLDELVKSGEFSHSMDRPILSFLNCLTDMLIIPPLIEACLGYELITGEDLSEFQRGMKVVGAIVSIFSYGRSVTHIISEGFSWKKVGLLVVKEASSNTVTYWVGESCNELGLPVPFCLATTLICGIGWDSITDPLVFGNMSSARIVVDDVNIQKPIDAIDVLDADIGTGIHNSTIHNIEFDSLDVKPGVGGTIMSGDGVIESVHILRDIDVDTSITLNSFDDLDSINISSGDVNLQTHIDVTDALDADLEPGIRNTTIHNIGYDSLEVKPGVVGTAMSGDGVIESVHIPRDIDVDTSVALNSFDDLNSINISSGDVNLQTHIDVTNALDADLEPGIRNTTIHNIEYDSLDVNPGVGGSVMSGDGVIESGHIPGSVDTSINPNNFDDLDSINISSNNIDLQKPIEVPNVLDADSDTGLHNSSIPQVEVNHVDLDVKPDSIGTVMLEEDVGDLTHISGDIDNINVQITIETPDIQNPNLEIGSRNAEYNNALNSAGMDAGSTTSAQGLIGHDFEYYLTTNLDGEGSFSVGGREFDGRVGDRWWEAKSGQYWEMLEEDPAALAKFKSDMGDRLRIATQNHATLEIISNTPIPESIKTWLTKKGIPFTELLD